MTNLRTVGRRVVRTVWTRDVGTILIALLVTVYVLAQSVDGRSRIRDTQVQSCLRGTENLELIVTGLRRVEARDAEALHRLRVALQAREASPAECERRYPPPSLSPFATSR